MLEWAFTHAEFKTQLFRFVDVFPRCRDADDVLRHLSEYFDGVPVPRAVELGLDVAEQVPLGSIVSAAVARRNVRRMARQFIAAEDAQGAVAGLRRLWDQGEAITVDLLGEQVVSDAEAQRYADRDRRVGRRAERGNTRVAGPRGARARSMGRAPTSRRVREAHRALAALRTAHGRGGTGRGQCTDASGPRPCARRRGDGPPRHRARRGEGPRVRAAPATGPRASRRAAGLRGPGLPEGFATPTSATWWHGRRPTCRSHCASAW